MVLISYFLVVCLLLFFLFPSILSFGRPDVVKFFAKARMGSKTVILLTKFPIYSDFRWKFMTKFPKYLVFSAFSDEKANTMVRI